MTGHSIKYLAGKKTNKIKNCWCSWKKQLCLFLCATFFFLLDCFDWLIEVIHGWLAATWSSHSCHVMRLWAAAILCYKLPLLGYRTRMPTCVAWQYPFRPGPGVTVLAADWHSLQYTFWVRRCYRPFCTFGLICKSFTNPLSKPRQCMTHCLPSKRQSVL